MMELVERVMCVPAAAFHGLPDLDGFQPGSQLWLGQLLRTSYVTFRDRTRSRPADSAHPEPARGPGPAPDRRRQADVPGGLRRDPPEPGALESDPAWVQVVAYVVVRHRGDVLVYRRGGSEPRLESRLSVGFGGHVEDRDCEGHSSPYYQGAIRRAALRELGEELHVREDRLADLRPVGLVRDGTSVGRHHLGVVYTAEVDSPFAVTLGESIGLMGWFPSRDLAILAPKMERWSRILVEQLLTRDLTNPA